MSSSCLRARYAWFAFLFPLTLVELRPQGEQEKRVQLEAVKRGILDRLGLHSPPVIRRSLDKDALQRMFKIYEEKLEELRGNSSKDENLLAGSQRKVHLLTPKLALKTKTSSKDHKHEKHCHTVNLVFSRTMVLHQEMSVVRAELQLYKRSFIGQSKKATRMNYKAPLRVNIYKVVESVGANGEKNHTLLDSKPFDTETLSLNVVTAVKEWIASNEEILQLEVTLVSDVPLLSEVNLMNKGVDSFILEIETQEVITSRVRKTRELPTEKEDCKKDEKKCCRKSLHISFKEIGWSDWVIAPESYTMFFCDGSCPHNYKSANMHAQIKSRMHHFSNGATPAPCCVPASYESILLMHYNSAGELILTPFEDMLVQKCRCA